MRLQAVVCTIASLALVTVAVAADRTSAATSASPAAGWTIHIDAEKHFGDAHPSEIAHHWCKKVDGMLECQIYDADSPTAHLVAVETIVDPATYRSFEPVERARWHYHRDEIPKVNAKTPDMTAEESKKFVADVNETYGKVWVLWDPAAQPLPTGTPTLTILQ
ncbi:MAG: hypothetical protein NVS2B8_20210 [Vulcanimicrobiaceae bacterium]